MFPLGTVLLPHMVLPLHVFEPRYRSLMHDVLAGDREFGVVLISRGHEVGGGEERTSVGTIARVLRAEELEDGRWLTVAVGTRRVRVDRWLPEDPYPLAEVVEPSEEDADGPEVRARLTALEPRVRRVLGMQAELGEEGVPATVTFDPDPVVACWQLPVVCPLTAFDAQRVLEAETPANRLDVLADLLDDLEAGLTFRLTQDG
jgi:uncharacterized protein